ncbi:hypothetical protein TRIUR3_08322 [Triticum urartu]|uniref:Uncharacterized protein n=1 Tax=Triticum urartu TaxID=4572 RepID=M7ZE53_TRIUA|nr:hypothetical protein TRIUR3_08322 [Triticum urartu]
MARQCLFLLLVAVTVMAFGVAGASKDVTGGYLLRKKKMRKGAQAGVSPPTPS